MLRNREYITLCGKGDFADKKEERTIRKHLQKCFD